MSVRAQQLVVVIRFDDQLQASVARASLRNRWTVLDGQSNQDVTSEVLKAHPRAALVQLPGSASLASRLIERLRNHWSPIMTIAVAGDGSVESELEARRAGATAFVPAASSVETIESVVEALVPGAVRVEEPSVAIRGAVHAPSNTPRPMRQLP
jgi:ActR/RegA family two-component response regulator